LLDVQWLRPDGQPMEDGDWTSGDTRAIAMLLANKTERVLVMCNAHHEDVDFTLPPMVDQPWQLLIDTAEGTADPRGRKDAGSETRTAQARSLVLLESRA
jgi:glycogen operon protein